MRRWRVVGVVVGCAYAVVLAGCTGSPAGGGTSTTSLASVTPATPSSASPTTSSAGDGRPDAAKEHTQAGAEAFLRYFFDQLNVAWTTPDAHALDGLCEESTEACDGLKGIASTLAKDRQRYASAPVSIVGIHFTSKESRGWRFELETVQNRANIVDTQGRVVKTKERSPTRVAAYVQWTQGAWRLTEFKALG